MTQKMNIEDLKEKISKAILQSPIDSLEAYAEAVLSAIEAANCTVVPNAYKAEMELLEEICALYTRDEDRYLKEDGEPYGLVPVDAGIKARSAAQRFYDREAMLSASPYRLET